MGNGLSQRCVYRDEGVDEPEDTMEFRLTYEGELLSTRVWVEEATCAQCGHTPSAPIDGKAEHKHRIRKHFQKQMRRLWEVHPLLKKWMWQSETRLSIAGRKPPTIDALANKFTALPFRWVPLVTEESMLTCSLDVLYLRGSAKGSVLNNADIDNRVKTLIDALKIPKLGQAPRAGPDADEEPFFVLLEDDSLVTRLVVETDILLASTSATPSDADARVIINVKVGGETLNRSVSPMIAI